MAFYSRNLLLSLRNSWKSTNFACSQPPLSSLVWQTLTSLGIRATRRGQRGGNHLRQRSSLTIRPIVNLRRTGSEIYNKMKTKRVNYGNLLNIQNHTSCDRTTPLRVNKARHGSRNLDFRELKHQTFLIHVRHGWTHRTGSRTRFTRQMQTIQQTNVKPSQTPTE